MLFQSVPKILMESLSYIKKVVLIIKGIDSFHLPEICSPALVLVVTEHFFPTIPVDPVSAPVFAVDFYQHVTSVSLQAALRQATSFPQRLSDREPRAHLPA